jgi:hypothetical protein
MSVAGDVILIYYLPIPPSVKPDPSAPAILIEQGPLNLADHGIVADETLFP